MPDDKIKVLAFINSLEYTGAPKITIEATEALRDKLSLRFVAPQDGPLLDRCRSLGEVDFLEYVPEKFWIKAARHLRRQSSWDVINQSLKRWRPDVVYIGSVGAIPLVNALQLPPAPVVLHVHELKSHLDLVAGQPCFQTLPARYIAVSQVVKQALINNYGISTSKISSMYEFVPDAVFEAHSRERVVQGTSEITIKPFVVGGAGTVNLRKGVTLWLLMAEELKRRMGQGRVRFVWVGVGKNHDAILFRQLAEHLGLEDDIEFVPVTPNPLSYFQQFDVFASTSLEDPCPLVVLENMMMQTPVACFADSGGAPEEVGETGLVISKFNPKGMAEAIADLLETPERRAAMGYAARKRVQSHFLASKQVPVLLNEFNAVLGRDRHEET